MCRSTSGALVVAVLLVASGESVGARSVWTIEDQVEGLDTTANDISLVGDLVCYAERRKIKVVCLDAATRKQRLRVERLPSQLAPGLKDWITLRSGRRLSIWNSVGMSVVGKNLVQGYARRGTLILLRINTHSGKLVDWFVKELGAGVHARVLWTVADGNRALVAYKLGSLFARSGTISAIDLDAKREVSRGQVPTLWPRRLLHRGHVIFRSQESNKDRVLRAWEISSGKERWVASLPGKRSPKQPGASGDRVYVTDDGGWVHALDLASGHVLRSARLTRKKFYTYARPVVAGKSLFVAADRLYKLDPATLKRRGTASFGKAQPIGPMRVAGDAVAVYNSKKLWLFDTRSLRQVALLPTGGSWRYQAQILAMGDRLIAMAQFRYNNDYQARLDFFRRAPLGRLDLRGLPALTGVFRRGRLVGGRSRAADLPVGEHSLDILRPGHYPQRIKVTVTVDGTKVPAATSSRAPSYPPASTWGRLPDAVGLRRLFNDRPRTTRFPRPLWRTDKWVHGGQVYVLGRKSGLAGLVPASGRAKWKLSSHRLRAILSPDDAVPRRPDYKLAAITPEGTLIVVTSGQLTNFLAAFSLTDGSVRWKTPLKYPLPHGAAKMGVPVSSHRIRHFALHDGMIWCKLGDALQAYDLRDGRLVLSLDAGHDVTPWGELIFAGGRLYYITVRSQNTKLVALRLYDLKPIWSKRFNSRRMMLRSSDGKNLILLGKRIIQTLDLNGRRMKTLRLGGGLGDVAPVVVENRIYLCGNHANRFYAVRQTDLRLLWTFRGTPGRTDPCPIAANKHLVAASADPSQLMLLDPKNGALLAHRQRRGGTPAFGARQHWTFEDEICFLQYDGVNCYPAK